MKVFYINFYYLNFLYALYYMKDSIKKAIRIYFDKKLICNLVRLFKNKGRIDGIKMK